MISTTERKRRQAATAKRRAILERLTAPSPDALLTRAQRTVALAERLHRQGRSIPAELLVSAKRDIANRRQRLAGGPLRTARELGIRVPERRDE